MTRGRSSGPLVHHELCFGCGRANLFGLLVEVDPAAEGSVTGRCFLKQDHQGARPGTAHEGVLAAALAEVISLAHGSSGRMRALEVRFAGSVPVGSFLELEASAGAGSATADGRPVAFANATWD